MSETRDSSLITCVVVRGAADGVVKAAMEAGAQGATTFFARGTGVRQRLGLLGNLISPEKEVVLIVTQPSLTDPVFDAVILAAKLEEPGKGFAWVQKLERAVGFVEA